MHKFLFTHPVIGSYSTFLLLGLLGGFLIARWRAPRAGVKAAHIDNLVLLVSILSLFGARLFSWIFYFPPGVSLWQALTRTGGGMVFYGGMIFGLLTVIAYARAAQLELRNQLDIVAPGLALGLALGRVGCFMAGCCWGDVCVDEHQIAGINQPNPKFTLQWQIRTMPFLSKPGFPLAVRFPREAGAYEQHLKLGLIDETAAHSLPVHPVQLYEAVLAIALCLFLHWRFSRRQWHGEILCVFLWGYGAIRFATEFLRADNAPIYFGLTLSQVISILLAATAAVLWFGMKPQWAQSRRRTQPSAIPQPNTATPVHGLARR